MATLMTKREALVGFIPKFVYAFAICAMRVSRQRHAWLRANRDSTLLLGDRLKTISLWTFFVRRPPFTRLWTDFCTAERS